MVLDFGRGTAIENILSCELRGFPEGPLRLRVCFSRVPFHGKVRGSSTLSLKVKDLYANQSQYSLTPSWTQFEIESIHDAVTKATQEPEEEEEWVDEGTGEDTNRNEKKRSDPPILEREAEVTKKSRTEQPEDNEAALRIQAANLMAAFPTLNQAEDMLLSKPDDIRIQRLVEVERRLVELETAVTKPTHQVPSEWIIGTTQEHLEAQRDSLWSMFSSDREAKDAMLFRRDDFRVVRLMEVERKLMMLQVTASPSIPSVNPEITPDEEFVPCPLPAWAIKWMLVGDDTMPERALQTRAIADHYKKWEDNYRAKRSREIDKELNQAYREKYEALMEEKTARNFQLLEAKYHQGMTEIEEELETETRKRIRKEVEQDIGDCQDLLNQLTAIVAWSKIDPAKRSKLPPIRLPTLSDGRIQNLLKK